VKVLVVSNVPVLGGSPLVAIDLARALAARGHEPIFAVAPGPTDERARAEGLTTVALPAPGVPAAELRRAVLALWRRHRPALIHAYEPPPIDAAWSVSARTGVPVIGSMLGVPRLARRLPREVPVLVGGRSSLARSLAATRPGPVWAQPLPVDVERDRPWDVAARARAREQLGLPGSAVVVAAVARHEGREVLAGIEATIRAVGRLGDADVHVLLAGDGPARRQVEGLATECCAHRAHVVGVLTDPRPAYAAAEVLVGRGTTVARAMAHGVAAIVQDEAAHPCLLDASTLPYYRAEEFVSVPDAAVHGDPVDTLTAQLGRLARDADERTRLGALGRQLICETRSLEALAPELEAVYEQVVAEPVPRWRVAQDDLRQRAVAWRRARARRGRTAR
jgi:glycosyltransferase involved in cell wall biosynthesis